MTEIAVDDHSLNGSLKIPQNAYTACDHRIEIRLGSEPPSGPWLLEAVGAIVLEVTHTPERLALRLSALGLINLRFFCPTAPKYVIEGASADSVPPLHWSKHTGIATLDLEVIDEIEMTITL